MKAMIIDENKNFVWTDVPEPVLADDGVIVEIHATARTTENTKYSKTSRATCGNISRTAR